MDLILKYFPDLPEEQKRPFAALYDIYLDWNSKINVISRKMCIRDRKSTTAKVIKNLLVFIVSLLI